MQMEHRKAQVYLEWVTLSEDLCVIVWLEWVENEGHQGTQCPATTGNGFEMMLHFHFVCNNQSKVLCALFYRPLPCPP